MERWWLTDVWWEMSQLSSLGWLSKCSVHVSVVRTTDQYCRSCLKSAIIYNVTVIQSLEEAFIPVEHLFLLCHVTTTNRSVFCWILFGRPTPQRFGRSKRERRFSGRMTWKVLHYVVTCVSLARTRKSVRDHGKKDRTTKREMLKEKPLRLQNLVFLLEIERKCFFPN